MPIHDRYPLSLSGAPNTQVAKFFRRCYRRERSVPKTFRSSSPKRSPGGKISSVGGAGGGHFSVDTV